MTTTFALPPRPYKSVYKLYRKFKVWRRLPPPPPEPLLMTTVRVATAGIVVGGIIGLKLLPYPATFPPTVIPTVSESAVVATAPIPPAPPTPPIDTKALIQDGIALVAQGNIVEARVSFETAARAGDPEAALSLAATFDPEFLKKARLKHPVVGDPERAKFWYNIANQIRADLNERNP